MVVFIYKRCIMAQIKLTEGEIKSLIREAIERVKTQEEKPKTIKINFSELRSVVKKALTEYRNRGVSHEIDLDYGVDGEYNEELGENEILEFSIRGFVDYVDQGIGSYEFQGTRGFNEDWGYQVRNYGLIEGSYDPAKKIQIDLWIDQNSEQIKADLIREAEAKGI